MSEVLDRRASKKARTRAHIRDVAQRMFGESGFDAVTVAQVAGEASVAVQTVFNHFPTKEELFFDGRLPWIDGPAEAVRRRPPGVSPLAALRTHLVEGARHFVEFQLSPEGRAYAEALDACPSLAAHEQHVVHAAEQRLAAALADAWATDPEPGADLLLSESMIVAPLTAAMWLAATRVLVVEERRRALLSGDPSGAGPRVQQRVDGVLAGVQAQLDLAGARRAARAPVAWSRRAG